MATEESHELIGEGEISGGEVPLEVISDLRITPNSLHNAARDNRVKVVEAHISHFFRRSEVYKVNKLDLNGFAPIHYAAKFNRYDIMKKLVAGGEDVLDASDEDDMRSVARIKTRDEKWTPLHFAARYKPRYIEEESPGQDSEESVTYLSSSKQAVQFLVTHCRVDVNAKAKDGTTPLHLACQRGNNLAVELLLKCKTIDEGISDQNGDTPLHEACLSGETNIVEMILEKLKARGNINVLLPNDKQLTPLHIACREGFVDIVKLLLKYAFHQRDKLVAAEDNERSTPLHLSCENGREGNDIIVQTLLLNNANIFAQMENGITPMHIAAHYGHVKVMGMLNSSGENIFEVLDEDDQTPLHYAAENNQVEMIEYLIANGADIRAADSNSYTPLLTAAANGQVNAFRVLRERGAQLDILDRDSKSVVFVAAEANHVPILNEIVADIIGAKLCSTPDSYYNTPLHIAAKLGHLDAVRVLIGNSMGQVKLDSKNDLGKTAMHLAAEFGHVRIVTELLNKDVETVIDVDEDSNTPLHLACISGAIKVAKVLIDNKVADVEARNANLWTPMDCAAVKGHSKIIQLLIAAKADINPVDRLKVTPLHLAAREGHLDAVKVLLESNADVGAITGGMDYGDNPLDLAIENGHEDVAVAILSSDQWEKALRNTTYLPNSRQTTPLRKLIKRMPEVAKLVFDRCSKNNATKDGKVTHESKDFKVIFNYEFLEDYRDVNRPSILNCWRVGEDEGEVKANKHKYQTLDRRGTHGGFTTDWGPKGFVKNNHPLSIMVESERAELLTHPLVTSLLNQKWKSYGQIVFYSNLGLYLIFVLFLTILALILPNPQATQCQDNIITVNDVSGFSVNVQAYLNSSGVSVENNMANLTGFQVCNDASVRDELARAMTGIDAAQCASCDLQTTTGIFVSALIVVVIAGIRLCMELFQFLRLINALEYIKDIVNWIEVILFVCSILFAFVFFNGSCLCPFTWQWEVGVVAVFLAWIDLIIFLRKIPLTGIYVLMFFDIFFTFWKMIILTSLLVIAFGLSFYMTFNQPGILFSRSPFSDPARSILKTMTMTTGEFEFDNVFQQTPGGVMNVNEIPSSIPFPVVSYILWIIFLILMPILLTNLLVGLAVDDIKGILEAAALKRLALQVELALSVEALMPKVIRRKLIRRENKIFPNRKLSPWEYFRYEVLKINRYDSPDKIANALNPVQAPIEQVQVQTRHLVRQIARMQETLNALAERIENMDKNDVRHRGGTIHHEKDPPTSPEQPQAAAKLSRQEAADADDKDDEKKSYTAI